MPRGFNPIVKDISKELANVVKYDAYMVAIAGDFAFAGGVGGAVDVVFLNKGDDKGVYVYRAFDVNVGFALGLGAMAGGVDFNPSYPANKIDRTSFEGWSFALSGSSAIGGAGYVRAYQDGKAHLPGLPWNPDYLYWGVLSGLGVGSTGGMANWSNAALWFSFPK